MKTMETSGNKFDTATEVLVKLEVPKAGEALIITFCVGREMSSERLDNIHQSLKKINTEWKKSEFAIKAIPKVLRILCNLFESKVDYSVEFLSQCPRILSVDPSAFETQEAREFSPRLLKVLTEEPVSVTCYLAEILDRIDSTWIHTPQAKTLIPLFLDALKNEDINKQHGKYIISTLVKSGNSRAFEAIISNLQHNDRDFRHAAVESLGNLGDKRAIAPLIGIILAEQNIYSRILKAALHALKKIDSGWSSSAIAKRTVPLLFELNKNGDYGVRNWAILLLAEIGDSKISKKNAINDLKDVDVLRPLVYKLFDKNDDVRDRARKTLDLIDTKWMKFNEIIQIIPDLKRELKDRDSVKRKAIAELLYLLSWKPEDNYFTTLNLVALQKWNEIVNMKSMDLDATYMTFDCDNPQFVEFGVDIFVKRGKENSLDIIEFLKPKLMDTDMYIKWASAEVFIDLKESYVNKLLPNLILEVFEVFNSNIPGFFKNKLAKFSAAAGLPANLIKDAIDALLGHEIYTIYLHEYNEDRISLEKSNKAIGNLLKVNDLFTSCILKVISEKKDISISVQDHSTVGSISWGLDFSEQRLLASKELKRRGFKEKNPIEIFRSQQLK